MTKDFVKWDSSAWNQWEFIIQERLHGDAAALPMLEWICLGFDILIGLEQIISPSCFVSNLILCGKSAKKCVINAPLHLLALRG